MSQLNLRDNSSNCATTIDPVELKDGGFRLSENWSMLFLRYFRQKKQPMEFAKIYHEFCFCQTDRFNLSSNNILDLLNKMVEIELLESDNGQYWISAKGREELDGYDDVFSNILTQSWF